MIRLCKKESEISNLVLLQCVGSEVLVLFHAICAELRTLVKTLNKDLKTSANVTSPLENQETNGEIFKTIRLLSVALTAMLFIILAAAETVHIIVLPKYQLFREKKYATMCVTAVIRRTAIEVEDSCGLIP